MRTARILVLLLASLQAHAQTVLLYSRIDAAQAHRVQQLASLYGPAFIDKQLPAGVLWRSAIASQICDAGLVLLLWSSHAAASDQVRREIDTALACRRPIVPVLLDATPLPGLVADVNAIDWR